MPNLTADSVPNYLLDSARAVLKTLLKYNPENSLGFFSKTNSEIQKKLHALKTALEAKNIENALALLQTLTINDSSVLLIKKFNGSLTHSIAFLDYQKFLRQNQLPQYITDANDLKGATKKEVNSLLKSQTKTALPIGKTQIDKLILISQYVMLAAIDKKRRPITLALPTEVFDETDNFVRNDELTAQATNNNKKTKEQATKDFNRSNVTFNGHYFLIVPTEKDAKKKIEALHSPTQGIFEDPKTGQLYCENLEAIGHFIKANIKTKLSNEGAAQSQAQRCWYWFTHHH